MKKFAMTAVVSVVALLGSGCVSLEEFNRTVKSLENEQQANTALAAENARLEGEVDKLRSDNMALDRSLQEIKDQASRTPTVSEEDLISKMQEIWGKGLRSDEWEYVRTGSAVGIRLDDSGVLFKTGSWDLTDGTKGKLDKLATILVDKLNKDANLFVRIDGHTDTDPVKKLTAKGIKDNTHLSTMRAMAVREYLVSKGAKADRLFVAGFGEFWPLAGGNSAKDKQRNRRVEVYLGDANALSIGALPGAQVSK